MHMLTPFGMRSLLNFEARSTDSSETICNFPASLELQPVVSHAQPVHV